MVDADGLNAFDGQTELLDGRERPLVLTPHPGEMSRLAGITIKAVQADRLNVARSFAREHHLVLVLKGNRTIIALPDGTAWVNPTGNPGMATGGTGDILTGMTAGVIAQMPNDIRAAPPSPRCTCTGWRATLPPRRWANIRWLPPICSRALPEAFRRAAQWAKESAVHRG